MVACVRNLSPLTLDKPICSGDFVTRLALDLLSNGDLTFQLDRHLSSFSFLSAPPVHEPQTGTEHAHTCWMLILFIFCFWILI